MILGEIYKTVDYPAGAETSRCQRGGVSLLQAHQRWSPNPNSSDGDATCKAEIKRGRPRKYRTIILFSFTVKLKKMITISKYRTIIVIINPSV